MHLLTLFHQEYRLFLDYVKRFVHMAEAGNYSIAHGAAHGARVMLAEPARDFETRGMGSLSYELSGPGSPNFEIRRPAATYPTACDPYADYKPDDFHTSDDDEYTEDTYLLRESDEPDMTFWSPNDLGGFFD